MKRVGRPRAVSDDDILYATYRTLGKRGFAGITLRNVADELGVTPAALVKRFGSKRALLLAFYRQGSSAWKQQAEAARRTQASPLTALRALYMDLARHAIEPTVVANTNSYYAASLGDRTFRSLAEARAKMSDVVVRAFLDEAINCGELRSCDTARVSRVLRSALHGAFVFWAMSRSGEPTGWVEDCFAIVLGPLRTSRSQ